MKSALPTNTLGGFSFGNSISSQPPSTTTTTDKPPATLGFSFSATTKPTFSFGTSFSSSSGDKNGQVVSLGLSSLPNPAPLGSSSSIFQFNKPTATSISAPSLGEGNEQEGGGESGAGPRGDDDAMPVLPQADLTKGEGEEGEETLFSVKTKIFTQVEEKGAGGEMNKTWKAFGVGILKVSQKKGDGTSSSGSTTRVLCRAENGRILINSAVYKNMPLSRKDASNLATALSIQTDSAMNDASLVPCLLRVKNKDDLDKMIETLDKVLKELN